MEVSKTIGSPFMSCRLNSLSDRGDYIGEYRGGSQGDARSLDYSLHAVPGLGFRVTLSCLLEGTPAGDAVA